MISFNLWLICKWNVKADLFYPHPSPSWPLAETITHALVSSFLDYCNGIRSWIPSNVPVELRGVLIYTTRLSPSLNPGAHVHWLPIKSWIAQQILFLTYKSPLRLRYLSPLQHLLKSLFLWNWLSPCVADPGGPSPLCLSSPSKSKTLKLYCQINLALTLIQPEFVENLLPLLWLLETLLSNHKRKKKTKKQPDCLCLQSKYSSKLVLESHGHAFLHLDLINM